MQRLNLTFRFLIPVSAVLAVVTVWLTWAVGAAQARHLEQAFQDQLTTLAVSSPYMLHSAAAEFCRTQGMAFHRVLSGQVAGQDPVADFERTALETFRRNPALGALSWRYRDPDGTPRLYVLAPAKLQEECASCHFARGMKAFQGVANGELVGAFGVSVSTAGLQRDVARTRLLAVLTGLGMLGVVALVVSFFVRRSILRPLDDLSGAIARMTQGDLSARAPVASQDEIGRLETAFNQMAAQLQRANQDYMEVLAFVSHELKNPIASMITDARVLADGYLGPVSPDQAQKLERLIGAGAQLLELVREYLDLSRIEGGSLVLQRRTVDFLDEVLEPAVGLILAQVQSRRMELERIHPAKLEPVFCDPHLMRIVLVNLLGNAVKYGRDGGVIMVTVEPRPGVLRVAVFNEGPGFPAEERDRLFRKFSRLQDPALLERRGTGIGLYTAFHIVRQHGGTVDARSEHGKWAEFSVFLPLET